MKTPKLGRTLLATMIAVACNGAFAAGLGRISVFSALGQPLRAEVEISATPEELQNMSARVAPPEAFSRANIEYSGALTGVRMTIERRSGGAVLKISSDRPFSEPFVDMLVELNWSGGRLLREYTFLLDPTDAGARPGSNTADPVPRGDFPATVPPVSAPERQTRPAAARAAPTGEAAAAAQTERRAAQAGGDADSYTVKRGDTATSIARQLKSEDVSQDQMLAALYQSNTSAFAGGNINRLSSGTILRVPSAQQAQQISRSEARQIVLKASNFEAYRQAVASAAAAAPAKGQEAGQGAGGKIDSRVEDKSPAAVAGKDQLKITKTEPAKTGQAATDKASAARTQALQDDLAAREKALKEAGSRVSELERNVKELQKLIELKNQQLAELQKQASSADAASKAAQKKSEEALKAAQKQADDAARAAAAARVEAERQQSAAAAAAVAAAAAQAAPDQASLPQAESVPMAAQEPASAPVEESASAPASEASARAAVTPPVTEVIAPAPEEEKGILSSPLAWLIMLAALLGAAFVVVRHRRRQPQTTGMTTSSVMAEDSNSPNSVFGSAGGQTVDTGSSMLHTDFSQSGLSAIDTDEGVDPVAEADVYMAYGRDAQAEEILLDALKTDPSRTAVYVKLLEIYAQRRSLKPFDNIATALYTHTNGVGEDWLKAAALGQKLDPTNPLYRTEGEAAATEPQPVAVDDDTPLDLELPIESDPEPEPAAVDFGSHPVQSNATWTIPGEINQYTNDEAIPASQVATSPEPLNLDFNLDLDIAEDEEPPAKAEPHAEPAPPPVAVAQAPVAEERPADEPLEFDIDVGEPTQAEDVPGLVPPAAPSPVQQAAAAPLEQDTPISLDFDIDDTDEGDVHIERAPQQGATSEVDLETTNFEGNLLDFDFELGEELGKQDQDRSVDLTNVGLQPAAPVATPAPAPAPAPASVTPASAPAVPSAEKPVLDLDLGDDEEPLGSIDPEDEVSTKLDLARAYEEMGDIEGARELLEEVMSDGSAQQKEEARSILARIA